MSDLTMTHLTDAPGRLTVALLLVAVASGLVVQTRRVLASPPFSSPF